MNVLIVDDIASSRKLLRLQLEAAGHAVTEAADGVEALQVLAREKTDAIISDILMPRMDGYRLCHEVRKSAAWSGLMFILHSSTYTSPSDVRLSGTVGADQFIAKPASVETLLAALQLSVGRSGAHSSALPPEAAVLQQYSAVLVSKLEEKNAELQASLVVLQCAHDRIAELNAGLERRVAERTAELTAKNAELTAALANVKQLSALLPICSYCKKIRDEAGHWQGLDIYVAKHTDSKVSHGVCPRCYEIYCASMLARLDAEIGRAPPGPGPAP